MDLEALSPQDAALWDQACLIAQASRGLGFEALSQSVPMGWQGLTLLASCPTPVLRCLPAEQSALRSLRQAFQRHDFILAFVEPSYEPASAPNWSTRRAASLLARKQADFESFKQEPLARAFQELFSAEPSLERFTNSLPP